MNKALILIDYINEIVNPDGKTPACAKMFNAGNCIEKINAVTQSARASGWMVVWVKVCFSKNFIEVHNNSKLFSGAKKYGAYIKDTWATELIDGLEYCDSDYLVYKHRVSAFFGTNLDLVLRSNGIDELFVAGVSTEMAVQTTVRAAHDRDYKVNIISDLCASGSLEFHKSSLEMLGRIAEIVSADKIIYG